VARAPVVKSVERGEGGWHSTIETLRPPRGGLLVRHIAEVVSGARERGAEGGDLAVDVGPVGSNE
jgi:hypothetical protein